MQMSSRVVGLGDPLSKAKEVRIAADRALRDIAAEWPKEHYDTELEKRMNEAMTELQNVITRCKEIIQNGPQPHA